ncbi:hypothetical protein MIND_00127600 [Mycena indigotica]|uniref:Cell wall protein n=1 Tax=Mycena indigotica TaxID=2126181 RepID=A0A8H6TEM9_9AGAR|nr:uncharacterized protein MIND_00127600 [Mycena indigotica]KAF7316095.1 hypothetical protein MIND_00127600 [Mycena indigotica]
MFSKASLLFAALIASGSLAAPVVRQQVTRQAACDQAAVTKLIGEVSETANFILNVGLVAPDPDRNTPAKAATFDTLVAAVGDATTAAAGGDFATAKTKLDFVRDTASSLIDPEAAQNGLVSGDDFDLRNLAKDASEAAALCVAPGQAAAAAPVAAQPPKAKAKTSAPKKIKLSFSNRQANCDLDELKDLVSSLSETANFILNVGLVAPDPDRATAAKAATFDTLVLAVDDANTAVIANDFATAKTKLDFIQTTARSLIDPEQAQNGLVSGDDFKLVSLARKAGNAAAACA